MSINLSKIFFKNYRKS